MTTPIENPPPLNRFSEFPYAVMPFPADLLPEENTPAPAPDAAEETPNSFEL